MARVVMIAARQPDDDEGNAGPRVLMRAKSNIGPDDGGFNYELQLVPMREYPDIIASVVSWGATVEGSARDILAEAEAVPNREAGGALQEATDFLLDLLADGPKSAKECKSAATDAAQSWAAVRRAQNKLGIKPRKDGMTGGWNWSLPEDAHQNAKVLKNSRQEDVSTFGDDEHLRGSNEALSETWEEEI
jgi:putative DNA primase/helicase